MQPKTLLEMAGANPAPPPLSEATVVVIDVQRGVIAEVERPWGFIQQWSPDASYVVLSRSTFHAPASKLAKFEFQ